MPDLDTAKPSQWARRVQLCAAALALLLCWQQEVLTGKVAVRPASEGITFHRPSAQAAAATKAAGGIAPLPPQQSQPQLATPPRSDRESLPVANHIPETLDDSSRGFVMEEIHREDRMAETVHVMPGGRTVEGTLLMDRGLMVKYFHCESRTTMCWVPQQFRRCEWCSRLGCHVGELEANGGVMFYRHTPEQRARLEGAARAFTRQEPLNGTHPLVDVMLFSCHVNKTIPMNIKGNFTLRLPVTLTGDVADVVVSKRLAHWPPIVPAGSVATCGRATYGEANADHIVQMSEYLRHHGFASLYIYNAGSTSLSRPIRLETYLGQLAATGSTALRYMDLRNHLDTLYGSAAQYAFLSSHSGGQEWTKYDCALRARRDGHDWILHTDLDEYIFPGKAMIEDDLMKPMAERLKGLVRPGYEGFSVASVKSPCDEDVNPESSWPLEPTESRAHWESFMRRVSKRYLDVVLKDPLKYFPTNGNHPRKPEGNPCDDYHMCLNGAGTRKLFLKSSFWIMSLRVHATWRGGKVHNEDADVLHTEHYRCMNSVKAPARLMAFTEPMSDVGPKPAP